MDDLKRNGSGYIDPTMYKAVTKVEKERRDLASKVIKTLKNVAHLAGFEIVGRLTLRDTRSGEIFK